MKRHTPSTWPYDHHPEGPDDRLFGGHPYFERHIYLYREQLLFDVRSEINIIAKTRKTPEGKEDLGFSDIADNNSGMLNRWIDKYVNLAKGRMAAYILDPFKSSKSDALKQEDEIDIELQVPFSWDDTTFQPLVQSVHDYIVNGVMYEILSLTLPPREHVVNAKKIDVEQSYSDIKRYITSVKPGKIKKPLQPF